MPSDAEALLAQQTEAEREDQAALEEILSVARAKEERARQAAEAARESAERSRRAKDRLAAMARDGLVRVVITVPLKEVRIAFDTHTHTHTS